MLLNWKELRFDGLVVAALSFCASCMVLSPIGCGASTTTDSARAGVGGQSSTPAITGGGSECGEPCPDGELCSAGVCALECFGGTSKCGNTCVNLQLDPADCGQCGNVCAEGELCSAGACALECFGGTSKCGDACVNLQLDPANCGQCGNVCAEGELCSVGACAPQCFGTTTQCGNTCVDLQVDPADCGQCDKACPSGELCVAGKCELASGAVLESKSFPNTGNEFGFSVAFDGAGNSFLAGRLDGTLDFGLGPLFKPNKYWKYDAFVAKFDPNGDTLWAQRFGGNGDQSAEHVVATADGGAILVVNFEGSINFGLGKMTSVSYYNTCMVRFSPQGSPVWQRHFPGAGNIAISGIAVDSGGNIVVGGHYQDTIDLGNGDEGGGGHMFDMWLAKYDENGNYLWGKTLPQAGDDRFNGLAVNSADNIVVTGYFSHYTNWGLGDLESVGSYDVFLVTFDKDGMPMWQKRFGDSAVDIGEAVAFDSDGNIILVGEFWVNIDLGNGPYASAGHYDVFLAKFKPNGTHLWSKHFGDAFEDYGQSVEVDANGQIVVATAFKNGIDFGGGTLISAGGIDLGVAKFAANGAHLWSKRFGGADDVWTYDSAVGPSGKLAFVGNYTGTANFGAGNQTATEYDHFLLRLQP